MDHEIVATVEPSPGFDPDYPDALRRLAREIRVLNDQKAFDDLWHELRLDMLTQHHPGSAPPEVDFSENVVLTWSEGHPAESADPVGPEPEGSTLWLRFDLFEGGCQLRQGGTLYVVSVRRDDLPDRFYIDRDYWRNIAPDDMTRQQITIPPLPGA